MNWSLIQETSGAESDGATDAAPGCHPADQEAGTAALWVAPGAWVENHLFRLNRREVPGDRREAVRDFAETVKAVRERLERREILYGPNVEAIVVAMVATYLIGGAHSPWPLRAVVEAVAAVCGQGARGA